MRLSFGFLNLSLAILILAFSTSSCGTKYDGSTLEGKAAIIDAANAALNKKDCLTAISIIDPVYNSTNTDNQVRAVRAAAYGCLAGITSFFGFLGDMADNRFEPVATEGMYLWRTAAKLFYKSTSSVLDTGISASHSATDANLSQISPGYYVSDSYAINSESFNVGSTLATDRTSDSNFYQILVSLSAIGALENRYSSPSTSTWKRGNVLGYSIGNTNGWASATSTPGDGCYFASSVLNMLDAVDQVSGTLPSGPVKTALGYMSALSLLMDAACELGCNGGYAVTGCALTAGTCYPCPRGLRNSASCTGLVTDKYSCAAAGIANYLNTNTTYGWVN